MAKFSERIGVSQPVTILQTDDMSMELRNSLWNVLYDVYEVRNKNFWTPFGKAISRDFRKTPIDNVPAYDFKCREWVKLYFFGLQWYAVYDFIEYVINSGVIDGKTYAQSGKVMAAFNAVLEKEHSGYRFVSGILAPITNPVEIGEISDAIASTATDIFGGAHHHLKTAVDLFSKRPTPDYRNSIKESISAVESIARFISPKGGNGLAGPLNELAKQTGMHTALKDGFIKLYGYSSDEDGVRHAILDEVNVGFDEAKYMLVACSAFVSYMIAKIESKEK